MLKRGRRHTIDVVFVMTLACAFAASILMVLMLGANVYSNIQKTANEQFNERISLSYISAKVRSVDAADAVRVGEFEGVPALFLDEEFYGHEFSTVIYVYDGWLREIFTDREAFSDESSWLTLETGTPLIESEPLYFIMVQPNLLAIGHINAEGESERVFIALRSEMGGHVI